MTNQHVDVIGRCSALTARQERRGEFSFWSLTILTLLFGVSDLSLLKMVTAAQDTRLPDKLIPVEKKNESQIKNLWTRTAGSDWSTFLGPTADGKSSETGIVKDWTAGKLKVLWSKELGEGYGMGSVSAGRFYHFDRHDGQARVRCFHAESGAELWTFQYVSQYQDLYGYDSGPRASPVVDGERVYVFGVEGIVHCLSADSGKEIWQINTAEKFGVVQNFFGVASTPVICGNLLLLMVGGSPPESQAIPPGALDRVKPNGCGIVAVDKFTGEIKYQTADDLASYSTIKLADFDGQQVAYAWLRESLTGFNPQTGEILLRFPWRSRKLESVNASMPVVEGAFVLVSECYEIGSALLEVKIEEEKGYKVVWSDKGLRNQAMQAHWNTPIVVGGMMYGCSGRNPADAELRCVEFLTGKVGWTERKFSRSSLTYIDGHFVLLDEEEKLLLMKVNSGRFEPVTEFDGGPEQIRFKAPCWAAPIISHGLMYVRGKDQLVCFELIPVTN